MGRIFLLEVNGKAIFSKGANWIPADGLANSCVGKSEYRNLQSSVDANMNMIRVWGGGIYETPEFCDLCDEMGLLVWQDLMFACSAYLTFDSEFRENIEQEIRYNMRVLGDRTQKWSGRFVEIPNSKCGGFTMIGMICLIVLPVQNIGMITN